MRPYMRAANVTWQGIDTTDVKEMDFTPAEYKVYALRRGDILLGEASGSPGEVGKPAIWRDDVPGACFQNTLIRVRTVIPGLVPFLHLHFVRDARNGRFAAASRGVGIHHLGSETLSDWEVELPPLAEQRRIVEATESYFSRLDDAVATLERVQRNLKRYRASVLKAAVEGRLVPTEAELARAEGRDYEPASVLLDRILAERRRRWHESGARGKYQEPAPPDTTNLPTLPEGWCWAKIDAVGDVQLGRQRAPRHHNGPYMRPYLRVANVFEDRIDTSDVMEMNFSPAEYETYRLVPKDILLNEGQSPHLVGRPAMYRGEVPGACFQNTLVRFRAVPALDADYALIVFRAQLHSQRYLRIAKITTNIAHLGAERFSDVEFPLPPLAEQRRIVSSVQETLSLTTATDRTLDAVMRRCARLRQAILKWAFEGKLADQDPDDEPASVLVERIRMETAARAPRVPDGASRKARRRRGRVAATGDMK